MIRKNAMDRRTTVRRTEHVHCQEYAMSLVRWTEHDQEDWRGQGDYGQED